LLQIAERRTDKNPNHRPESRLHGFVPFIWQFKFSSAT
jgi:hypothetical protein